MNIQSELEKLTKNIFLPSVFYIPHVLFPDLAEEIRQKLEEEQFFNTIGIIGTNEVVKPLKNYVLGLDIFNKSNFLKSNFIQLVEFENKLTKEAFSHLINEYLNSAYTYNHVYTWMAHHIEKDIPTIPDNYKKFFVYQAESLNNHILEINDRFVIKKEAKNATINFNQLFDYGKDVLILDDDLKTVLNLSNPTSITPTKRKGKMLLPSDEEVDNMLLASVFNVNFSKVK